MLLRLQHLVGDSLWEAVSERLGTHEADCDEDVNNKDEDNYDDDYDGDMLDENMMALVNSAIKKARVRREKVEAAKVSKRAKVTFKDDFKERGDEGGGGGKSHFGKRISRTGKKPFNRSHSSMN